MRWPLVIALAPLLLPGCYVGPVFKLQKQSKRTCDEAFLTWTGGLTYHVVQGPGDGSFSYDPLGDLIDRIEGEYDLRTGDFSWETTYADDSFRSADHVDGAGTIWRDGDMEVSYDLEATYADESVRTWTVHTQRYGCRETTRLEDEAGGLRLYDGEYDDDSYEYVHDWIWGPLAVSGVGERDKDGGWQESAEIESDGYSYSYTETGDGEGEIVHEFDGYNGAYTLEGSWTATRDGQIAMDYTAKPDGAKKEFWDFVVDGSGTGEGSWEQDGVTCNLKFEAFDCKRRQCSDDSNGSCTPPVALPTL